MIKDFTKAWEENRDILKNYISSNKQECYCDYGNLLEVLFVRCINPYLESIGKHTFETSSISEIDDGDYHGTLIFLIPLDHYRPDVDEYVFTSVSYGSCSCCDTLQGIHNYDYGYPNEEQVNDYMSLMLHMLQKCKWLVPRSSEENSTDIMSDIIKIDQISQNLYDATCRILKTRNMTDDEIFGTNLHLYLNSINAICGGIRCKIQNDALKED